MRHVGLIVEHRMFVHGELRHLFILSWHRKFIRQQKISLMCMMKLLYLIKQFFSELLDIIDRVEGTYLITALIWLQKRFWRWVFKPTYAH